MHLQLIVVGAILPSGAYEGKERTSRIIKK